MLRRRSVHPVKTTGQQFGRQTGPKLVIVPALNSQGGDDNPDGNTGREAGRLTGPGPLVEPTDRIGGRVLG
jgi:hypothetical protein